MGLVCTHLLHLLCTKECLQPISFLISLIILIIYSHAEGGGEELAYRRGASFLQMSKMARKVPF